MEEMTNVFEQCQRMEAQRLQQFKEILFGVQRCLNISEDPVLPQIYEEFYHTVNNADHEKDLKWWSNTYGVNMPMNWPQFEEYSASVSSKSYDSKRNGAINKTNSNSSSTGGGISRPVPNNAEPSYRTELSNGSTTGNGAADRTPFDEEEWDDGHVDPLVDNGEPGIKVRALYDYEAAEDDELDFKAGDTFEKLEDEDEQGWCKGRKDGKVGLYPANYIEVI